MLLPDQCKCKTSVLGQPLCERPFSSKVHTQIYQTHLFTIKQAVVPYVISDFIANLPLHILTPAIFTIILYFMAGLRTTDLAGNLFVFIANNILCQLVRWSILSSLFLGVRNHSYRFLLQVVVGFALIVASFVRTYATASLTSNALQIFLLLTAGYL